MKAVLLFLFTSSTVTVTSSFTAGSVRNVQLDAPPSSSLLSLQCIKGVNGNVSNKSAEDDHKVNPHAISCRRRSLLNSGLALCGTLLLPRSYAGAAETVGKDPDCNASNCLGVWDGLLADCPHSTNKIGSGGMGCVSSQDDTPGIFAEPWDYSDVTISNIDEQMNVLKAAVKLVWGKKGDVVELDEYWSSGRYLRAYVIDAKSTERSTAEFYFTDNDSTVQFRIGSDEDAPVNKYLSRRNMEREEDLRKFMKYSKLPVLRNRQRKLIFGESVLDTFGPGSASLGPPEEMSSGELEGRLSDNKDVVDYVLGRGKVR